MIELEKTYLAKYLPENLERCPAKEMIDVYIPAAFAHPKIRIRKNGDKYEITKKEPLESNPSEMLEQTIKITAEEFAELQKLPGKEIHKTRYHYKYERWLAEIDVFQDKLAGLVVIDFEFETKEEKDAFQMPNFCLADVTTEQVTAGGMLCGKSYKDIEPTLNKYHYQKIRMQS
jgi:CYTH domain-containing protein